MLWHKPWGLSNKKKKKNEPVFGRNLLIDSIADRCVSILAHVDGHRPIVKNPRGRSPHYPEDESTVATKLGKTHMESCSIFVQYDLVLCYATSMVDCVYYATSLTTCLIP